MMMQENYSIDNHRSRDQPDFAPLRHIEGQSVHIKASHTLLQH
jgi:hypothetical protein